MAIEDNSQTLVTNPAVADVTPAEGQQNVVAQSNNTDALSLADINAITKHSYTDIGKAKEGLANLVSFTGKKVDAPQQSPAELAELRKQLNEATFYMEHPELKEFKGFLGKFGDNPAQALQDPEVNKALEAMKTSAGATQKETPVLQTNSRIAAPTTDSGEDYARALAQAQKSGMWSEFLEKYKGIKPI